MNNHYLNFHLCFTCPEKYSPYYQAAQYVFLQFQAHFFQIKQLSLQIP